MGDTAINVPVKVRTQELQQFHTFMQDAVEHFREAGVDEEADAVERVYEEHIEGITPEGDTPDGPYCAYLSMPMDDWRTAVRTLTRFEDQRAWWLQSKVIERLDERMDEMEDDES